MSSSSSSATLSPTTITATECLNSATDDHDDEGVIDAAQTHVTIINDDDDSTEKPTAVVNDDDDDGDDAPVVLADEGKDHETTDETTDDGATGNQTMVSEVIVDTPDIAIADSIETKLSSSCVEEAAAAERETSADNAPPTSSSPSPAPTVPPTASDHQGEQQQQQQHEAQTNAIASAAEAATATAATSATTTTPSTEESATSTMPPSAPSATPAIQPSLSLGAGSSASTTAPASSLILCLPFDSLHSIASFLSPNDWSNFGCTSYGSQRICREILRRIRMHGFRCAIEVITAWKLGQHADAKELASLYISSGVPIYPHSLGHSYHTMMWRMDIEAQEMQQNALAESSGNGEQTNNAAAATANNSNNHANAATVNTNESNDNTANNSDSNNNDNPVDSFFRERQETRDRDLAFFEYITYMEEKSLYHLNTDSKAKEAFHLSCSRRRELSMTPNRHRLGNDFVFPPQFTGGQFLPPDGLHHHHTMDNFAFQALPLHRISSGPFQLNNNNMYHYNHHQYFHDHINDDNAISVPPLRRRGRSNSFSDTVGKHTPKVKVRVHRHLLDQHLLGHRSVYEPSGKMETPPISLSVDFFNPTFPRPPMRLDGRYGGDMALPPTPDGWHAPQSPASIGLDPASIMPVESQLRDLIGQEPLEYMAEDDHDSEGENVDSRINDISGRGFGGEIDIDRALMMAQDNELPPPPQASIGMRGPMDSFQAASAVNYNYILSHVDLDLYSATSIHSDAADNADNQIRRHLQHRCSAYKRRLKSLLTKNDNSGIDDCMLDLWDEFLPQTAGIHYYDRHTPVPRLTNIHKFLTKPCPKAIGKVQCEIERIKLHSKKKGVSIKGRLFPTYEYRLFIRHRGVEETEDIETPRKDTVLMVARYRGRKESVASSTKKAANNFSLCLPQLEDIQDHYQTVNETTTIENTKTNGADATIYDDDDTTSKLLGKLQSNFIGTEFQIFSPRVMKPRANERTKATTTTVLSEDEEGSMSDNGTTTKRGGGGGRRMNFRRRHDDEMNNTTIHETVVETTSSTNGGRRSLRRTRSSGNMRSTRANRRAIANTATMISENKGKVTHYVEEDGAIIYTANLLGSRPRIMDVCIPRITQNGAVEWRTYLEQATDMDPNVAVSARMLNRFKVLQQRMNGADDGDNNANNAAAAAPEHDDDDRNNNNNDGDELDDSGAGGGDGTTQQQQQYTPPDDFGLLALQNRPPWWNAELQSFVLNFGGRVSVASVKNFQLCDRNDQEYIILQFGRIQGRHAFTMDYQYPLTATQAFAIAISSLQSKISFA